MLDIYFISTIINIIWQVFSILFVLYRFTSFFTMIYNYTKFLNKITLGIIYIKSYITKRNEYDYIIQENKPKTFFESLKSIYNKYFEKISKPVIVTLYETTYTDIHISDRSTMDDFNFTKNEMYHSNEFETPLLYTREHSISDMNLL